MARVTYGESITEYAGSIGGITYMRNASGPIAKLRSNPPVNPSPAQAFYENRMAMLVSRWPMVEQYAKILWDAFAAANLHTTPWKEDKKLSGYQWFLSINLNRLLYHAAPIFEPPDWQIFAPPDPFQLFAVEEGLFAVWEDDYEPTDILKFHITLPLRQSSIKLRRSLFYVGYRLREGPLNAYDLTEFFTTLTNVSWPLFFLSAQCSIICRIQHGDFTPGLFSYFTSAIIHLPFAM